MNVSFASFNQGCKSLVLLCKREIVTHKAVYVVLLAAFLIGLLLRTYRSFDLLRFYYDQGRDALEVQKIIAGNLTLIGPTTGYFGIFRGPFWYYWLTPSYLFGGGNPGTAALFNAAYNALGIVVVYSIGARYFHRIAGLIAAWLMAVSYYAMLDARWLSNPSPLWLFAPLTFLFTVLGVTSRWWYMPLGMFFLGITLQLEEAGMGFVLLGLGIFALLYRKRLLFLQWLISGAAFASTFLPLIVFDLRNNWLISSNVLKLLFGPSDEKSFGVTLVFGRFEQYLGLFSKELFINGNPATFIGVNGLIIALLVFGIVYAVRRYSRNPAWQLLWLWLLLPLVLLLFYQKPLFEYYLMGLYPIFFLLVGIALYQLVRSPLGRVAVVGIVVYLSFINLDISRRYLSSRVEKQSETVHLENQMQAVAYVVGNPVCNQYALNIYVPPMTPYAYDYLVGWHTDRTHAANKRTDIRQAQCLYTLHEVDTINPQLATWWVSAQDIEGSIVDRQRFGGIFVEKRDIIKRW